MKRILVILPLLLTSNLFSQNIDTLNCFTIQNVDLKTVTICKDDMQKMPRDSVQWSSHGDSKKMYSGVRIQNLLEKAGAPSGSKLRGKSMLQYIVVKCADNYAVVFSLAELDAELGNHKVLLADKADGKPLAAGEGPFRLIVSDERKAARSAYQVRAVYIKISE